MILGRRLYVKVGGRDCCCTLQQWAPSVRAYMLVGVAKIGFKWLILSILTALKEIFMVWVFIEKKTQNHKHFTPTFYSEIQDWWCSSMNFIATFINRILYNRTWPIYCYILSVQLLNILTVFLLFFSKFWHINWTCHVIQFPKLAQCDAVSPHGSS